ncbi:MAG: hypothetical protein LBS59_06170, partial [Puniceicoccales bacterium]|nr:hypothetical protein [Puniceicoccales bacterium]
MDEGKRGIHDKGGSGGDKASGGSRAGDASQGGLGKVVPAPAEATPAPGKFTEQEQAVIDEWRELVDDMEGKGSPPLNAKEAAERGIQWVDMGNARKISALGETIGRQTLNLDTPDQYTLRAARQVAMVLARLHPEGMSLPAFRKDVRRGILAAQSAYAAGKRISNHELTRIFTNDGGGTLGSRADEEDNEAALTLDNVVHEKFTAQVPPKHRPRFVKACERLASLQPENTPFNVESIAALIQKYIPFARKYSWAIHSEISPNAGKIDDTGTFAAAYAKIALANATANAAAAPDLPDPPDLAAAATPAAARTAKPDTAAAPAQTSPAQTIQIQESAGRTAGNAKKLRDKARAKASGGDDTYDLPLFTGTPTAEKPPAVKVAEAATQAAEAKQQEAISAEAAPAKADELVEFSTGIKSIGKDADNVEIYEDTAGNRY